MFVVTGRLRLWSSSLCCQRPWRRAPQTMNTKPLVRQADRQPGGQAGGRVGWLAGRRAGREARGLASRQTGGRAGGRAGSCDSQGAPQQPTRLHCISCTCSSQVSGHFQHKALAITGFAFSRFGHQSPSPTPPSTPSCSIAPATTQHTTLRQFCPRPSTPWPRPHIHTFPLTPCALPPSLPPTPSLLTPPPVMTVSNDRSFWSSGGHDSQVAHEALLYELSGPACRVVALQLAPYRALYQEG